MRSLAILLFLAVFPSLARADAKIAVWTQPVPMLLLGPSIQESFSKLQLRSIPLGTNIVLGKQALVIEALVAPGARANDCGLTQYWGGWLAVGLLIPMGQSVTDGLFIQPKLVGTYFNQSAQGSGCVDLGQVTWSTLEWDVGLDVGFQLTFGPLYVAPVLGVFAGQCFNCADSSLPSAPYFLGDVATTLQRFNFGFNLNLLRVGAVW